MDYVSTRGAAPILDFEGVTLAGLASDGGLYVPARWPTLSRGRSATSPDLTMSRPPSASAAVRRRGPDRGRAARTADTAYTSFAHAAVAPLRQLDGRNWLLELFHGPTLAFKDVAMQALGLLFETFLSRRTEHLTIIGATSGDTGSAAIAALAGRAISTSSCSTRPAASATSSAGK